MKYRSIGTLIICLSCFTIKPTASQDVNFGMINMCASAMNPALTGWNNNWTAGLNYQNTGINKETFETTQLYGEYNKVKHAGGLNILNDASSSGIIATRKMMASYAYHYCTQNSGFRFGIGVGLAQKIIDFSKLTFSDNIDPRTGFVTNTNSPEPLGIISFGLVNLGVVGYYKNVFLSMAVHNINNPNRVNGQKSP